MERGARCGGFAFLLPSPAGWACRRRGGGQAPWAAPSLGGGRSGVPQAGPRLLRRSRRAVARPAGLLGLQMCRVWALQLLYSRQTWLLCRGPQGESLACPLCCPHQTMGLSSRTAKQVLPVSELKQMLKASEVL